ncbi:hypothetical protein PoB_000899500 [Plakobranchus ocellatus]|uniref:G-protein coupled receptors family 2 profile 2 domain-containing protein n=1 Tax=Plakobranchus ocellatus TaxID=259542 RepID=A0AAV3YHC2_9GAST|nr:hypothetical protein PoB_000899500 [Plakobranchus ocellatus]
MSKPLFLCSTCTNRSFTFSVSSRPGLHCPPVNDSLLCWGPALPNTTVSHACPILSDVFSEYKAYRTCLPDGTWLKNYTDYAECFKPHEILHNNYTREQVRFAKVLKDISLVTSITSLVFLLTALFIFCYFKSLQCSRISIHKHLVISFIIRFVVSIYMLSDEIGSSSRVSFREVNWLCKAFKAVLMYTQVANFSWMLVEGIYLHNRLVVSVFHSAAPFKLFCFIGWGIPAMIVGVWTGLMEHYYNVQCWQKYARSRLILIIFIPIVLALLINGAFLVNIIRVLVVKLRTNNLVESRRIKKAIKATVVLLPLLGVANLIFLAQPRDPSFVLVFRVINALLPGCQVQLVISKKWKRFRTNRAMNSRSRRQGSRSSYFMSQSVTGQTDTLPWRGRPPCTSRGQDGSSQEAKSYTLIITPEGTPRNGHKGAIISSLKLQEFPQSSPSSSRSVTPIKQVLFSGEAVV